MKKDYSWIMLWCQICDIRNNKGGTAIDIAPCAKHKTLCKGLCMYSEENQESRSDDSVKLKDFSSKRKETKWLMQTFSIEK